MEVLKTCMMLMKQKENGRERADMKIIIHLGRAV